MSWVMLSRLGGSPDGVGLAEVNYYPTSSLPPLSSSGQSSKTEPRSAANFVVSGPAVTVASPLAGGSVKGQCRREKWLGSWLAPQLFLPLVLVLGYGGEERSFMMEAT
jgi:hypothetical protein